jgi:hypothetical protein
MFKCLCIVILVLVIIYICMMCDKSKKHHHRRPHERYSVSGSGNLYSVKRPKYNPPVPMPSQRMMGLNSTFGPNKDAMIAANVAARDYYPEVDRPRLLGMTSSQGSYSNPRSNPWLGFNPSAMTNQAGPSTPYSVNPIPLLGTNSAESAAVYRTII